MVVTRDVTYARSRYDGHPKLVQFLSEKQNYKCLFTGVS